MPPLHYLFGESVPCQPNHGFVGWVDFDQPIKGITACVLSGTKDGYGGFRRPVFTGLMFRLADGHSRLLGRCTTFGPSIALDPTDRITQISVGFNLALRKQILEEVIFETRQGVKKGFGGTELIVDHKSQHVQVLRSANELKLSGMTWAFDLGFTYEGDQGVQGLYCDESNVGTKTIIPTLYPTITWSQPPPSHLRLRPVPEGGSCLYGFESSILSNDVERQLTDTNIISIQIYFNAYLQGVVFGYKNGARRTVGDTVGAKRTFELDEERVCAVYIKYWDQRLRTKTTRVPRERDWLAVEGLSVSVHRSLVTTFILTPPQFVLVKYVEGRPEVRLIGHPGFSKPWGPFINKQWGLHAAYGDSANWDGCYTDEVIRICITADTSFAGLYAETATVRNFAIYLDINSLGI